ncbi:MAG TPA: isocitrate/isopropylmalate family dehydrogenase [Anaerovoracaceae bacterium]|nr:isocitrate/isopropylmalate family dehydrogenase [Anaerovoracaceae bacterium]
MYRKEVKIAVLLGDGVGPELCRQAIGTLDLLAEHYGLNVSIKEFPCGAAYWQESGREWAREAEDYCRNEADAILFGSVGLPGVVRPDGKVAGLGVVQGLRSGLELYANLRPVELFADDIPGVFYRPEDIHLLLVREVTEGLYAGQGGVLIQEGKAAVANDLRTITAAGTERIGRFAFHQAQKAGAPDRKAALTCVDKSNVLIGCQLFNKKIMELAAEYPDVIVNSARIDNFALEVLRNPQKYQICVTTNCFGDILADLMAFFEGGSGMSPTGNFGRNKAMFEPLHGPQANLKGKNEANPVAIHRCLIMMLEWLAERSEEPAFSTAAVSLHAALVKSVKEGKRTPDIGGICTSEQATDAIREELLQIVKK